VRWQRVLAVITGAMWSVSSLALTGAASAQAAPAAPAAPGTASATPWGTAINVPGLHALNNGKDAAARSISCVSASDCTAAGTFTGPPEGAGFIVSENKGHWGKAIAVPGLGALIKTGDLFNISVSCGSIDDCSVGGTWTGSKDVGFAFVASETNGKWGKAIRVPGLSALETGKRENLTSLSCSPGRNCVAGGSYGLANRAAQVYVVSERNGHWGKAAPLPGLSALNIGSASVDVISCPPSEFCTAFGSFEDHLYRFRAFEANQK
jgi:hypothetical protein